MEEPLKNAVFIRTEDVLKKDNSPIVGLDQLNDFLQRHGTLFFNRLGVISMDKNSFGWHKIVKDTVRKFRKLDSIPSEEDSTFTGRNLCNFASFAIYDAIKDRLSNVDLDVVSLYTDTHGEKWDDPDHFIQPWRHIIVKAVDTETGEIRYFDPTYRQINHRMVGTIHTFSPEEIDQYYKNSQGTPIVMESVLSQKDEMLEGLKGWGLTDEKYQTLMKALK